MNLESLTLNWSISLYGAINFPQGLQISKYTETFSMIIIGIFI